MKFAYSYSRLDMFDKCPKAFEFKFIQKMKEPISPALILGDKFHQVAAKYNTALKASGHETNLELLKKIGESIADIPDDLYTELQDMVKTYGDYYALEAGGKDISIEDELALNQNWNRVDWMDADVLFRMKVDLRFISDGKVVIRDFKTDRFLPPKSYIEKSFQLDIYAFGAALLYPEATEFVVQLDYVRHQVRREAVIAKDDIAGIKANILAKIDKIENTKEFKPRLSSQCDWCGFKGVCPVFQSHIKTLNVIDIKTEDDARILAEKVFTAEHFIDDAKDKLKAWIENNRAIDINDERLDFHKSERISFPDVEQVISVLIQHGVDKAKIYDSLNLPQTAIKKLLKGNRDAIDDIFARYSVKDASTRFGFQKMKE